MLLVYSCKREGQKDSKKRQDQMKPNPKQSNSVPSSWIIWVRTTLESPPRQLCHTEHRWPLSCVYTIPMNHRWYFYGPRNSRILKSPLQFQLHFHFRQWSLGTFLLVRLSRHTLLGLIALWYLIYLHHTLTAVSRMQSEYHMGNTAMISVYLGWILALLAHSSSGLHVCSS